MKKAIAMFLMIGVMLTMAFASPIEALAAGDGNTVLIMKGRENVEAHEFEIDVMVEENAGVCGMLLSLVYDTSVFTLIGIEYGPAFSALSPMHTNTETEEGYGIYPFKITYLGEENDLSVGKMMTLRFSVRDNAPDGSYTIVLKHERDRDVTYLKDNAILTKNLLIDGARITLSGNKITLIDTVPSGEPGGSENPSDTLWLPILIGALVLVGGASLLTAVWITRKKSRKWKKI